MKDILIAGAVLLGGWFIFTKVRDKEEIIPTNGANGELMKVLVEPRTPTHITQKIIMPAPALAPAIAPAIAPAPQRIPVSDRYIAAPRPAPRPVIKHIPRGGEIGHGVGREEHLFTM